MKWSVAYPLAFAFSDGLGYYDDGEERYGDEDADGDAENKKRKGSGGAMNLSAAALKKIGRAHV